MEQHGKQLQHLPLTKRHGRAVTSCDRSHGKDSAANKQYKVYGHVHMRTIALLRVPGARGCFSELIVLFFKFIGHITYTPRLFLKIFGLDTVFFGF